MNLADPIHFHFRVSKHQESALQHLGIRTIQDLLYHFPIRYSAYSGQKTIADLIAGEQVTIQGRVLETKAEKTWKKRINIARAVVSDGTGSLRLTWFNQPYVAKMLSGERDYLFSGKVGQDKKGLYIANPRFEPARIESKEIETAPEGKILPIYPETSGITSRWFSFAIMRVMNHISKEKIAAIDPLPEKILRAYRLPALYPALFAIHNPEKLEHTEAARKRFAFEEIFTIQLARNKERLLRVKEPTYRVQSLDNTVKKFVESLPFTLTRAQTHAIHIIKEDMKKQVPMARLLEGDVGSGKTVVAAAMLYATAKERLQGAFMAPTEVVARQHYAEFMERLKNSRIPIGLITSSECRKFPSKAAPGKDTHISKNQMLKWIASGEVRIVIGTHALIQDKVVFKNLAFVVIDEQHRFGIKQRAKLVTRGLTQTNTQTTVDNSQQNQLHRNLLYKNLKGSQYKLAFLANFGNKDVKIKRTMYDNARRESAKQTPHLLTMTATPIPRTLALTIYGDLDVTLLDEMPPGRKHVITYIVEPEKRNEAYEKMRHEINQGRQAYVVCPRIEEQNDTESTFALEVKSVKEEYRKLKEKIFPEFSIGMLHGKIPPKEKEKIMDDFRGGKTHILVTTSVIEVGVNVPNATIIMIEGADRFGLAQLHQLRGRVLRSTHQPYCFIFNESQTQKTKERMQALLKAKNGFELAEYDLQFRGPGELTGANQWGISDIAMEALKNIKMVEAARLEAQKILSEDIELKKYPLLQTRLKSLEEAPIHLE